MEADVVQAFKGLPLRPQCEGLPEGSTQQKHPLLMFLFQQK